MTERSRFAESPGLERHPLPLLLRPEVFPSCFYARRNSGSALDAVAGMLDVGVRPNRLAVRVGGPVSRRCLDWDGTHSRRHGVPVRTPSGTGEGKFSDTGRTDVKVRRASG